MDSRAKPSPRPRRAFLVGVPARLSVLLIALISVLGACGGAPATSTPRGGSPATSSAGNQAATATSAAVPASNVAAAASGGNLLVNGGADEPFAGAGCSLTGWTANREVVATAYGSHEGEPSAQSPGPPDRGTCYLRMAIGPNANNDPTSQGIDVSASAAAIDAATASVTLSGWFGGGQGAHYDFNVRFLDASNALIDVAPAEEIVMPPDPATLALSTTTVGVPPGTRRLEVNMSLNYDSDCTTCTSVAYADSLSLVLGGG